MALRPKNVTQAKIERAIRAAKAEGLRVVRIVAHADGYAVETASATRNTGDATPSKPKLVL